MNGTRTETGFKQYNELEFSDSKLEAKIPRVLVSATCSSTKTTVCFIILVNEMRRTGFYVSKGERSHPHSNKFIISTGWCLQKRSSCSRRHHKLRSHHRRQHHHGQVTRQDQGPLGLTLKNPQRRTGKWCHHPESWVVVAEVQFAPTQGSLGFFHRVCPSCHQRTSGAFARCGYPCSSCC